MALKNVLLTMLLREGESTGYSLTKKFDAMWKFFWKSTHQQVYRELAKLVEEKLISFKDVKQTGKPDKKIYRLTPKGKKVLKQWLGSPMDIKKTNDELLVRLMAQDLAGTETIQNLMSQQREEHEALLAQYLAIEANFIARTPLNKMSLQDRLVYMPLRKGIHMERAWLDWEAEVSQSLLG